MKKWNDIKTAPRNGRVIEVRAPDDDAIVGGPHYMYWDSEGTNFIAQPETKGIWVDYEGRYTWSEEDGFGPTQWRETAIGA